MPGGKQVCVRQMANLLQLDQMGEARGQGVQIRQAAPDDAAAIASLLRKSFVEFETLYTSEGFVATVGTPDMVKARIDEGPVWVAEENQAIVGTVSAVLKGDRLYIRGMAVDPTARGKRIGCKLLDRAEEFAIEKGRSCLFLSTTPFLSRAIKLYKDYGFHHNSEGPDNLFGTPLFTMIKTLNALTLRKTDGSEEAL
jgi:ribosomal protein S18 acetylase RimI-like enzyme